MADKLLGVIGGSGLYQMKGLDVIEKITVNTPFGSPSDSIVVGELEGIKVAFLPRHGVGHSLPPHAINYRANIHALKAVGAGEVIAVNAVGGISERFVAGVIALPEQINDYTWGRGHTFYDGRDGKVEHVDFSYPYCEELRLRLCAAAQEADIDIEPYGTYAVTQGPRLETAAEIRRLARDGNDMVGMTAMPEAALAREAGLDYASVCLVVNPGAGLSDTLITMEDIQAVIDTGMLQVKSLLSHAIASHG